ncbi:hypothetical protein, partial [Streptomyces sp. KR55]|uniref:hypothetical protein n=1 Tax=Streptomyces sp. KR55 TaxID=3457425 RepID=UPI003FD18EA4
MSAKKNAPAATGAQDQRASGSAPTVATGDPIALCRARQVPTIGGGIVWLLVVRRCPLCRRSHTHGGGSGDEPFYGHRTAHCATATPGAGYWLQPIE